MQGKCVLIFWYFYVGLSQISQKIGVEKDFRLQILDLK